MMADTMAGTMKGGVIWLTRPLHQGAGLKQALETRGFEVLHLPMLEIEPLALDQDNRNRIMDLDRYDLVFFISTNAARLGLDCIQHYWPQYPAGVRNFAVGAGTAEVIKDRALEVFYPRDRADSEALLALTELENIAGRKALIVRGKGGREVLAEGLRKKGADVDYLEVYRRRRPEYATEYLRECLTNYAPDGAVVTSAEALEHFVRLISPLHADILRVPLFVSSRRLKEAAGEQGFRSVVVMGGAGNDAIVQSIENSFSEDVNNS